MQPPPSRRPARYISAFQRGFDAGLRDVRLSFMQSDGGLAPVNAFSGHKAVLSGPAGGCAGSSASRCSCMSGLACCIAAGESCAHLGVTHQPTQRKGSPLVCRYVGYALTTQWEGAEAKSQQIIGFDMGGTSTDVSRFAGTYEHVFESVTAGALRRSAPGSTHQALVGGLTCGAQA